MIGPTKATFGAGAEVLELTTVDQSRRIVVENLDKASTLEEINTALKARFGEIVETTLFEGSDNAVALVTMSTTHAAEDAVGFMKLAIPEGLRTARRKALLAYSIPETGSQHTPHLGATIEISCHYPLRLAWAQFSDGQSAQAVTNKLNGSKLWGRQLESRYKPPIYLGRSSRVTHSVSISNLPVDITNQALAKRLGRACHLTIDEAKYSIQNFERRIPTLLRRHGELISFEVTPAKDGAKKLYAFARFATMKESLNSISQLHGKTVDVLNNSPIYLQIINSIKYSVRFELWPVLENEIRKTLETCNTNHLRENSTVRFSLYERTDTHRYVRKFRIYSKDIKALGAAKMAVDKIVKGDTLLSEDNNPLWDPDFDTAVGQERLASLGTPNQCVVSCDRRLRTITIYGETRARATARIEILELAQSMKSQRHMIEFDRSQVTWLRSCGLRLFQSRFGKDKIRFDIVTRTLEVNGSQDDADEIRRSLVDSSTLPEYAEGKESDSDCPICYCEIENPTTLGCGHSYCKACFDHWLGSTIRHRLIPLRCVSCGDKVDISVLRDSKSFDELLSKSFAYYVSMNPSLYTYCPTPDCPQIYRLGPAGTVIQCSECLTHVCTFCKIEWHEGLTCIEIQEYNDPETRKNVTLMKELGIKPCPNCKTLLEKTMGCNHMTCTGCKTHLCWVCLEDFGTSGGQGVYAHMSAAHGGIGI